MRIGYVYTIILIILLVKLIINHRNKSIYIKAEFEGACKNTYINLYDLQSKEILPRVIIISKKGTVDKELRINKECLKNTYYNIKYKYRYLNF